MIKITDLKVSELFIFKEQSYTGRLNVVYKDHGVEFHELTDEQRNALMEDVATTAKAIAKVFNPDKINYGSFSDKLSHLHFHIVPKYVDGHTYGSTFEMNPQKAYLTDEEYNDMIEAVKAGL